MREIVIDTDTRVYYIYEDKSFYIENKDTTTPRTTATETKRVLDIVAPSNTVTVDDLISLAETYETLSKLSYTWEDTGAYISSIQLNDFDTHPICIDCEKSKLYIKNTQILFDLTLTEGRRYRLDSIQAYYYDTLGLSLTLQELTDLYSLLVSYYSPTPYNTIAPHTDTSLPLYYTNQVKLSNYRHTAPSVYTLTKNPNNLYTYTTIGHILSIENNALMLSEQVPAIIQVGQTLNVHNANTTVDTTTYTADGSYIVQSIDNNTIYTTENFSSPYLYIPPILSIVAYKHDIVSVSRDNNSITLTNSPTEYLIGDTITVYGTSIPTEYETLTVDGEYTIIDIQGNTLKVDEVPATDYTYSTGTQPYTYKSIFANNIDSITGINAVVTGTLSVDIDINTPVVIQYPDEHKEYATVIGKDENLITVDTTLTNYTYSGGFLRQPVPYTETLVSIEATKDTEALPVSTFMVDNDEQVTEYLSLISNNVLPTESNYALYTKRVSDILIEEIGGNTYEMKLLGLFSEVYKEE